jgi:hypothetical protein
VKLIPPRPGGDPIPLSRPVAREKKLCRGALLAAIVLLAPLSAHAQQGKPWNWLDRTRPGPHRVYQDAEYQEDTGSTFISMDSWIYPALDRLHGLGYLSTGYLGMRPWTCHSIGHMLEQTEEARGIDSHPDAMDIVDAVRQELERECPGSPASGYEPDAGVESVYTDMLPIHNTPLRDSYHVGQTLTNDYGRPYEQGFNNDTGLSLKAEDWRFSFYFRGEYQYAPSAPGYSLSVAQKLSAIDDIPFASNPHQATIPLGPLPAASNFRILEAEASFHFLGDEISIGKNDEWLGPAKGGAMLWSTNAEDIYALQINRVEPLHVPLLSDLLGPFRYQFLVGSLKGHTDPNAPWIHTEKLAFKPTSNLEFGFTRSVIWGGENHEPINLHTFLRSFFSTAAPNSHVKFSNQDPGDRLGGFDFTYRLPFVRNWLTLYADSAAHDDVSPADAPRRAAYRTGLYLSHLPKAHAFDLRVEAANTDPGTTRSNRGQFLYWEAVQRQGYTNKGFLIGDAIGREDKGGQAWLTYHLSPREWVDASFRMTKAEKDFIPGGTTQDDAIVGITKRLTNQVEMRGRFQHELYKVPLLAAGRQGDTSVAMGFTWYPTTLSLW